MRGSRITSEPKVQNLRPAYIAIHEPQVRRLDVSIDAALFMSNRKTARHACSQRNCLGDLQPPALESSVEVLTVEPLRNEKRLTFRENARVDVAHEARSIEPRQ